MSKISENPASPNATASKFGYPASLIADYRHWLVLLRPAQVTLGSLVVVAKDQANSFSHLPLEAFSELATLTANLEQALQQFIQYDRINWLMLMMVDPDVHFHVIPRYAETRSFGANQFADKSWPGPPDLSQAIKLQDPEAEAIRKAIKACWPAQELEQGTDNGHC